MKIKLTKIESTHERTAEALNHEYDEIRLNNTSLSLHNTETYDWLRTSAVKEIIIKTENSTYTLERVETENDKKVKQTID